MAHGVTTDKTLAGGMFHIDKITADAVLSAKNVITQLVMNWPGETPEQHKTYEFFGTSVPDDTDYPDTLAPIGSSYRRYIITAGAVSGFMMYYKTAAATWSEVGDMT